MRHLPRGGLWRRNPPPSSRGTLQLLKPRLILYPLYVRLNVISPQLSQPVIVKLK
jgi:hypothetical protein